MLPLWCRSRQCSLLENEPSSDSVQIVGECSSVALEQNPVQDTLAALPVHSQSCTMKSTVESEMNLVWTCTNWSFSCEYSVPFWVCLSVLLSEITALLWSSAVFLVSVCRAILDQVFRLHEMHPLSYRSCQWPVKYTVPCGKMNLVWTRFTLWENAVRLL